MFSIKDLKLEETTNWDGDQRCLTYSVRGSEAVIHIYQENRVVDMPCTFSVEFPTETQGYVTCPQDEKVSLYEALVAGIDEVNNWWSLSSGMYYEEQLGVLN